MSRDFASFMASISEESVDKKIKDLMEILDKVMQIVMNSSDQLSAQLYQLETNINAMTGQVVQLEQRPIAVAAAGPGAAAPGVAAPAAAAPAPAPKPPPKPMSPISARSALQGELKALFAKRKQR